MKQNYFKHIIMLCICLLTGSKSFAYDAEIDGIYYNFNGDNAEVTYMSLNSYFSFYSDVLIIP